MVGELGKLRKWEKWKGSGRSFCFESIPDLASSAMIFFTSGFHRCICKYLIAMLRLSIDDG